MTAANTYTKPQRVVAGVVEKAAWMNTYIRDNFYHLKVRQFATGSVSAVTTTSTSFVTMTNSSVAITTTGGYILWWANGWVQNSTGGAVVTVDLAIDGLAQGHATFGTTVIQGLTANYADNLSLKQLTGGGAGGSTLAAGSHTCSLLWKVSAGTGTATLNLFACEVA